MPMYEFQCPKEDCAFVFEKIVKFDTEEQDCPKCATASLRVMNLKGTSFRFNYMAP
jgi:putative FmdB family regulatory protein